MKQDEQTCIHISLTFSSSILHTVHNPVCKSAIQNRHLRTQLNQVPDLSTQLNRVPDLLRDCPALSALNNIVNKFNGLSVVKNLAQMVLGSLTIC
jgi:hypothetical protein